MDLQQLINIIAVVIFTFFGVFGNVQLLWTFKRKKELRTKSGLLLGINAVIHLICLQAQWVNVTFILFVPNFTKKQCYPFVIHFISLVTIQSFVTLLMAVEALCLLVFPLRVIRLPTNHFAAFVALFLLVPSIYCVWLCLDGWKEVDNTVIPFCNTIVSQSTENANSFAVINNTTNCVTVALYSIALIHFRLNGLSNKQLQRKVIRHMGVIVLFFLFSYFACQAFFLIGSRVKTDQNTKWHLQSLGIFPALLCYVQNFYLCIWRSDDFKKAFKEQLKIMGRFICYRRIFTLKVNSASNQ